MHLYKYVDLSLQYVLVKLVHNLASFTVYYVLYVHTAVELGRGNGW